MMELNSKENCIISKVFIVKTTDLSKRNMKDYGQGEAHNMSTCCELYVNENNEIMGIHHKIIILNKLKINLTKSIIFGTVLLFFFYKFKY
jgi:hypothetical protein